MRLPRPDVREYVKFVVTVLVTLAALQYAGVFYENAGTVDWGYLLDVGATLPVFTYLLTVVTENVDRVPDYERMTRDRPRD